MKICRTISSIIACIGSLLVLGSIGAVDCDTISLQQASVQILVGVIIFIGGVIAWRLCAKR